MTKPSHVHQWQMRYDDFVDAQSDRCEDISEPRSSPSASPCNSLNDIYDTRRSRACDACRNSKVRCEQPNPDLPCKRCAKARRECVSPTRGQKRRKSMTFNDQLMALGGKIDRLTETLCPEPERESRPSGSKISSAENVMVNTTTASWDHVEGSSSAPGHEIPNSFLIEEGPSSQQSIPLSNAPDTQKSKSVMKIDDVAEFVEDGINQIIDSSTAEAVFQRYCRGLAENVPAVVIHPAVSVSETRSTKPILFLAILAAASGSVCDMNTQKRLRALISVVLSHCYLKDSEYTLELVQASIILALWHAPSEASYSQDAMDMQQLSHAAANIAVHIGLGKQISNKIWDAPIRRYGPDLQKSKNSQAADDLEARRTWLGCYFICANASMPSQQPSLLSWSQYMDESLEILKTSPLALPSDKDFSKAIRIQRATDDHSRKLFASSLFKPASTSRPDTKEILDSFRNQMADCEDSSLNDPGNGAIRLLYHSSYLYAYEAIAAIDGSVTGPRPTSENAQDAASSRTIAPIPECVEAAHNVVSVFTSLELQNIRSLPTVFLIRIIHAMIFLVKFGVGRNVENAQQPRSLAIDDMRVEHQLDDMIEVMANWGSDWPACRLIQILIRLRKQLREHKRKSLAIQDPPPSSSAAIQEGEDTRSSTPSFPELPTPVSSHNLAQQAYDFKPASFPPPDDTIYGDPAFWDTFLEQGPQSDLSMSPSQEYASLWSVLQPQQQQQQHHPSFSDDIFSKEYSPSTGLFPEPDFTNPAMPIGDIDANMSFLDNAINAPH